MTVKKKKRTINKASVFAVPSEESASGKHEVLWAKDGDLNRAARRGQIKRFRHWDKAVKFAHEKGNELAAEVVIHSYGETSTRIYNYRKVKRESFPKLSRGSLRLSSKPPRITPRSPRITR